jgi:hypothetical protein
MRLQLSKPIAIKPEAQMKSLFIAVVLLASFSNYSFADKDSGDVMDMWISWCDQNNVMSNTGVKENCSNSQKLCVVDQATRGKYVYYSARCEDKPQKAERSEMDSQ